VPLDAPVAGAEFEVDLSTILVRTGSKLERGAVVGKLGSTGRSTGPHVHYEIWYDDVVRNPSRFLRAGTHVLQN
jgi:murein DD-endopeptidase MepM/ murein hydrolase activator NlpD